MWQEEASVPSATHTWKAPENINQIKEPLEPLDNKNQQ